jgi:PAS domain S-box-containing protein
MLVYYLLSFFITLITAVWLWRQGREKTSLARSLYLLLLWDGIRAILTWLGVLVENESNWPVLNLLQLLAWGGLLWGLELRLVAIAAFAALALTLTFVLPEAMHPFLHWGYLSAVPLAAVAYVRERTVALPIMTPGPVSRLRRATAGLISREMVAAHRPILECIADGVIVNSGNGLIEYANGAAADIMGVTTDALVGRPITDVLARLPVPSASQDSGLRATLNQFELNGRYIQGQMNIIYDHAGSPQGTIAVLRDVTAEYQAERAKNAFLTTVSHELRTPLTAIKGYIELLSNGTAGELNANQKMLLAPIQRNATRMVHLINSLIFASSAKGGRLEFTPGRTDLRQLIQQIIREIEDAAGHSRQTIKVEMDSRVPPIQADPIHMSTVLQELITNAVKYNRAGGEVRITVSLEGEENPNNELVVVSVSDQGIGIDPADQAHIFEVFYRPEQRDEQIRTGGMGVGLSIVRALVEAYNGRIWLESTPGEGSVFTFLIPIHQPQPLDSILPGKENSS